MKVFFSIRLVGRDNILLLVNPKEKPCIARDYLYLEGHINS